MWQGIKLCFVWTFSLIRFTIALSITLTRIEMNEIFFYAFILTPNLFIKTKWVNITRTKTERKKRKLDAKVRKNRETTRCDQKYSHNELILPFASFITLSIEIKTNKCQKKMCAHKSTLNRKFLTWKMGLRWVYLIYKHTGWTNKYLFTRAVCFFRREKNQTFHKSIIQPCSWMFNVNQEINVDTRTPTEGREMLWCAKPRTKMCWYAQKRWRKGKVSAEQIHSVVASHLIASWNIFNLPKEWQARWRNNIIESI